METIEAIIDTGPIAIQPENTEPPIHHDQTSQSQVQDYIDNTLAAVLGQLSFPDGRPALTLKQRLKKAPFFINSSNGALETNETETQISYTWPGEDAHEAWRFSMAPWHLSSRSHCYGSETYLL